jgi:iron complex transport system substrate-binding protein
VNSWLFIFFIFLFFSCNRVDDKNATNQHFTKQIEIKFAKHFEISENSTQKRIRVFSKDKKQKFEYFLSKVKSQNSIKIPVKKVVCMSTTHAAFINEIGKTETIIGLSGTNFIHNEKLNQQIKNNKTIDIGYEENLNFEKLIKLKPDVIFIYEIGNETSMYINKLKELKFNVVNVAEFIETSPLARAEWIKFFAAFYDEIPKAENLFSQIETDYNNLKLEVKKSKNVPTVITSIPMNNSWYVPGTKSYMYNLISDAGAKFTIYDNQEEGSITMNFENVFEKAINADYWINLELVSTKKDILNFDEKLKEFKAFKENKIYNNDLAVNKLGGNNYWEKGVVFPNLILKDLISIFHPQILKQDTLLFYRKMKN